MYYSIFLAIFLALACPSQKHSATSHRGTTITAQDDTTGDGDGENGHIPPQ